MLEKINDFKSKKTYLSYLIFDLEALLNVMEEKENQWEIEFRTQWLNLETVYALALNENKTSLDIEDQNIIHESIENLEKIINEKLESWMIKLI